jgi:hypothetical protein
MEHSRLGWRGFFGEGADFDYHASGGGIVEAVSLGAAALKNGRSGRVETSVGDALVLLAYGGSRIDEKADVKESWVGFGADCLVVREDENEAIVAEKDREGASPALVYQAKAEGLLKETGQLRHVGYRDVDVIESGHDAISFKR